MKTQKYLGSGDGYIRQASCSALASRCHEPVLDSPASSTFSEAGHRDGEPLFTASSKYPTAASIRSLHFIRNERTGDAFIICGSDDGGVTVLSLRDLKLLMHFIHFVEPLSHVAQIQPQYEDAKPFGGYVLCLSSDGTIAIITLGEFQLSWPSTGMGLPDYGTSRLANFAVQWISRRLRSHLLNPPGMSCARGVFTTDHISATEVSLTSILDNQTSQPSLSLSTISNESGGLVCVTSLALQRFIIFTATDTTTFNSVQFYIPKRPLRATPLRQLRILLSLLLTPTLSPEIDEICASKLGLLTPCGRLDHSCGRLAAACCLSDSRNAWSVSGDASALRAAAIVACLRALSFNEALHDDCETVIAFYATSLPTVVRQHYTPPDLVWLARKWFETTSDVRQATKVLVDAGVARLSDEESVSLVRAWERHLPSTEESVDDSKASSLAVFLCGYVSVEKHALLSNE
ncbi:hypothetical protein EDC04DRAFT_1281991 [Pisolithus marmoratus]|nr:hypothetical protein EDC04DRAFT_1281991 [Pisolithus marmoratus]